MQTLDNVAAVVIGRNEGERLNRCLKSLLTSVSTIVYVDSGSTDGSVELAQSLGVKVVSLDMTKPFTAARARNAGFFYIIENMTKVEYVQFVDGDCEVDESWLTTAYEFIVKNQQYAIVCGRRREKSPKSSVYNQMCDIEWNTPIGDALACGGDALMRINALLEVDAYNPVLIAGEEPEMCFRLRNKDWKIMRLDAEMTMHDAAITRFSQWWKRAKRSGYAYASSAYLHGCETDEHYKVKEVFSIVLWAVLLPMLILFLTFFVTKWALFCFIVYPVQLLRIWMMNQTTEFEGKFKYAFFTLIAKLPQFIGVLEFVSNKFKGKSEQLIEYK